MAKSKRDYVSEYRKFQSSRKSKKDRAKRNRARRAAMKAGKVHKGDGKEVDHTNGINRNEVRVTSAKFNRGRKGQGGRKRGKSHNYPKSRKS